MHVRNIYIEWFHHHKSNKAHLVIDMAIQWEVNLAIIITACFLVISTQDAKV